ncbi:hypothetical protein ARTSIC4J27_467 [Pseudarthrobacter siccitolerans]|uniref:Uncharacterized protein n=1 Tax=Pseudarthrobacter siccitolerans TaxID=861266 RepID=A0A024GYJ2_9MICC|nr:hypothetical protein ARTSIC4J27_467 [Pseudarthrobacter siccitolerans]
MGLIVYRDVDGNGVAGHGAHPVSKGSLIIPYSGLIRHPLGDGERTTAARPGVVRSPERE